MKKLLIVLLMFSITYVGAQDIGGDYYIAHSDSTYSGMNTADDSNDGTFSDPVYTLTQLNTNGLSAGDTVYIRGGEYFYTDVIAARLQDKSGTVSEPIVIMNYPGETVVWDCTNQTSDAYNYGLRMWDCEYIRIKGIELKNIKDGDGNFLITGFDIRDCMDIIIENCSFHDCDGIGSYAVTNDSLQYINCDSYNNVFGGEGDGWQISSYGERSSTFFKGCRSWNCSDDAWDLAWNDGIVELDSCWAFSCGYDEGDGNGFKMGIGALPSIDIPSGDSVSRIARNCIAAFNSYHGFTQNSADFKIHHLNCIAYSNGWDPGLGYGAGFGTFGNEVGYDYYRNCVAYDNYENDIWGNFTDADDQYNSWNTPPDVTISDDDFLGVDSATFYTLLTGDRQADGSLPDLDFLKLAESSDLIDAGTDVGLSYNGDAPDLGAFEWVSPIVIRPLFIKSKPIFIGNNIIYTSGCTTAAEESEYSQIIADHTVVDKYDSIPEQWMDSVKTMWLSYAGESHSYGVRYGLEQLEDSSSNHAVSTIESGTPESYTTSNLRANRTTWGDIDNASGWIHSYGEEDWFVEGDWGEEAYSTAAVARTKAGLTYCNTSGPALDVFAFGWCYDAGLNLKGFYIRATKEYEDYVADSIPTTIVWTTGPVDDIAAASSSEAYRYSQRHQEIRDSVYNDSTRILFDFADILSYNDAGEQATNTWDGHTYPIQHTENDGGVSTGAHMGSNGSLKLAKAMWWLLARIAGWDGETE